MDTQPVLISGESATFADNKVRTKRSKGQEKAREGRQFAPIPNPVLGFSSADGLNFPLRSALAEYLGGRVHAASSSWGRSRRRQNVMFESTRPTDCIGQPRQRGMVK